ncbi:MAG: PAS domain-containing protein [Alphaproteobacteria bacterium]
MDMRPELANLYSVWQEAGDGGVLPSRADLGPEALKPWLRNVALIDIEWSPLRFRRRLVGTKIVDYQGADCTGRYLVDRDPDKVDSWNFDDYVACATNGATVHRCERSLDSTGNVIRWERVLLPLAQNGRTPDKILVGLYRDMLRQRPSLPFRSPRVDSLVGRVQGAA